MKNDLKLKKIRKVIATTAITFIVTSMLVIIACATGAEAVLTNTNNIIFGFMRLVGIAILAWAFYEFGISWVNHDGAAKWRAVGGLAGGLIIVFMKEIIAAIGVSM